ncbi:hypothetical protein BGZ60DRAFT_524939 [Tricladium varicosporioides]|nr:hypothetical protein BGZ60DRAFT_524939 [Hymenoscyphus varicosporioides]
MYISTSTIIAVLSTLSISILSVSATPIPCTDAVRDQVLNGHLDPSACCSYGVCKGDVNIQGA